VTDYVQMPLLPDAVRELFRGAAWRGVKIDELPALEKHGIVPLVFSLTSDSMLRDAAIAAAAVEPLRLADLSRVLDALASAGVVPLILKGTALAYQIYPAPELRPRGDSDLLIGVGERVAVRAVLASLGYAERITSGDELAIRQTLFFRTGEFGVEHVYDVHWDIANAPRFARMLRVEELRERAVSVPEIGPDALALSRVDALLHACIHRVAHHHGSERLIWLYDIHLLREPMSHEEHHEFWTRAAERKALTICRRSVDASREWFGGDHDLASDFLAPSVIHAEEGSAHWLDRGRRRFDVTVDEIVSLPGWRPRLRRIRQLAFPPPAFMYAQFGKRSPFALPMLYAWRGVRGIGRMFLHVGRGR
jgi:hypothetical protein